MVKVKICGLKSAEDAAAALDFGADAVGFVLEPSSPRYVVPEEASRLAKMFPGVATVAVFGPTSLVAPPDGFQFVQATDWPDGDGRPDQIQALRLLPEDTYESAASRIRPGSLLLLDAYHESGYGGHGTRVNWSLAKQLRDHVGGEIALAGGLTAENVREAIAAVQPTWVDVSSGVEAAPGVKDLAKVRDFIQAAKSL